MPVEASLAIRERLSALRGEPAEVIFVSPIVAASKGKRLASFLENDSASGAGLTFADLIYESARLAPEGLMEASLVSAEAIESFLFRDWVGGCGVTLRVAREMQAQGFEVTPLLEQETAGFRVGPVQVVVAVGWEASRITEVLRSNPEAAVYTSEAVALSLGLPSGVYVIDTGVGEQTREKTENGSLLGALLPDSEEMVELLPSSLSRSFRVRKLLQGGLMEFCKSELFDRIADQTVKQAGSLAGAKLVGALGACFFGPAGGLVGAGVGHRLGRLPVGKAAAWLKEKTLLRSQAKELVAALSQFLQAASKLAETSNQVSQDKVATISNALRTNPSLVPLEKTFLWKLNDENIFRERKLAELERAKNAPECLSGSGLLQCADEAALLVRQAGVHFHGLRVEAEAVRAGVASYKAGQSGLGMG